MAHSAVAVEMGVLRSTVSSIWKNRDKYHQAAAPTSSTTSLVLCGSKMYCTAVVRERKIGGDDRMLDGTGVLWVVQGENWCW